MIGLVFIPILFLLYLGVISLYMDELVYSGTQLTGVRTQRAMPPGFDKWWLDHGTFKSEVWFLALPDCKKPAPVFIFVHPINSVVEHWLSDARWLQSFGCHVLLVEFPGYADSGGKPSEKSFRRSLELAYDSVSALELVDNNKIIGIGHSIGANMACLLSETRKLAGIIAFSGFSQLRIFMRNYLIPTFLLGDRFDITNALKHYDGPIFFIHGKHDHLVKLKQAEQLFNLAQNPEILIVDARHSIQMTFSHIIEKRMRLFLQRNNLLQSRTLNELDKSVTDA